MTISPGALATAEDILAALNSNASVSNAAKAAADAATAAASAAQTAANAAASKTYADGLVANVIMNAKDLGAKGDNANDDAPIINAAIVALNTLGGGTLYFPPGYYSTSSSVVLYPNVVLQGSGTHATIIGGASGTTHPVIITKDYSTLVGTNTAGGPSKFGLVDLSVDGNKFNRPGGDNNVLIYGYQYLIDNVELYNSPSSNMYSEWAIFGGSPPNADPANDFMESHITRLRSFAATLDGLEFNGPHDTVFNDTMIYVNGRWGATFNQDAHSTAGGTMLNQFHSYGNGKEGIVIGTQVFGSVIESESNLSVGGITITPTGYLVASTVLSWGNTGYGISINSTSNQITTLTVFSNTSDGVDLFGPSNIIKNLNSHSNGGIGLLTNGSAANSVISGGVIYSNSGFGMSVGSNTVVASDLVIENNLGGGAAIVNGASGIRLSATFSTNTGTQLQMNALGSINMIDAIVFTTSGQTAWTGTAGNNFVRIAAGGSDARVLNSVAS